MTTTRRKSRIDRRQLYIPRPEKWDLSKLSELEVQRRIDRVNTTLELLDSWIAQQRAIQSQLKDKLWAELPTAKLAAVRGLNLQLSEVAADLKALRRLYVQAKQAQRQIRGAEEVPTLFSSQAPTVVTSGS